MKKAFLVAKQKMEVRDLDDPELGPTGIRLQPSAVGICGSDVQKYKLGYPGEESGWRDPKDTRIFGGDHLGHEAAGTIVEVGPEVRNWKPGDRYRSNDIEGSFADCVVVPEENTPGNLHHLPDDLSFEQGAMLEPSNVAPIALSKTELQPGESVAILGAGGIGLLALQMCKTLGASAIYVSEINPLRREGAKALGADRVVDPVEQDIVETVKTLEDRGVDIVIETAGIQQTHDQMLSILKNHGRGVLISWWENRITVDVNSFVSKNLQINGSNGPNRRQIQWIRQNCSPEKLMREGKINIEPIITTVVPLKEIDAAFRALLEGTETKGMIHP